MVRGNIFFIEVSEEVFRILNSILADLAGLHCSSNVQSPLFLFQILQLIKRTSAHESSGKSPYRILFMYMYTV